MGQIIDLTGQPFDFDDELQTEQEALAMVMKRTQEHPSSGITPNRAAQLLRDAERGDLTAQADLAFDMEEKDTHIFSELSKRRLAIQGLEWSIEPPENATPQEKKDAAMLDELLRDAAWFEDGIVDSGDAILKGYSMQEIEWGWLGKMRVPVALHHRDAGLFNSNPDNLNELRLSDGSYHGLALQPFGWFRHLAKSRTGYVGTHGLVRTLVWPFIFKNYSVRDFAEFLEIYGLPMRVGKYPTGATAREKATLMQAVMDIGRRAGGIIPMGMTLDFQSAADGQADPFLAMIGWAEKSQSKAILGGTLTSDAGEKGARSLGEVHNEVRKEIRNADARQLRRSVNRDIIYPLQALNSSRPVDPCRLPSIKFDTGESEDMTAFAEAIPKLAAGMPIPVSWIQDKLHIPQPNGNEPVFTITPAEPATIPAQASLAADDLKADEQDAPDKLAAGIGPDELQNVVDPMLKPLIATIIKDGPEAAMKQATTLYPEMDDSALIDVLTRAIFVADLWGRLDATDR
jgi:Mu-like prophage protein gp29